MAGLDQSLDELRHQWDGIPPEIRGQAGELFAAGAQCFADGLRLLGPVAISMLQRPAIGAFLRAIQDLTVWGRSSDWVAARIETRFPLLITYLKALAPEQLLAPPPPPPVSTNENR